MFLGVLDNGIEGTSLRATSTERIKHGPGDAPAAIA